MTEILIDTNVLVYAHDLAEPQKRVQARHIIRELQQARLGCLSIQCISEFFHAVTRGSAPKLNVLEASNQANVLLNSFPVFPLTHMIALSAMSAVREYSLAYYDAQTRKLDMTHAPIY